MCTGGLCQNNGDCTVMGFDDACVDFPNDGELAEYCGLPCPGGDGDCPQGMSCVPGFNDQLPDVCLWLN